VSNAGFQKINWMNNYTPSVKLTNGNSGMSVGLVQFDFASSNVYVPQLLDVLISNLPDTVGGYSKDDLRSALEDFHARNLRVTQL